MTQPSPLIVVVGFLGSGKTTLIRDLLPLLEARELEPFVIINDYANARVDASSLQDEGRTVAPINGNCICCDSIIELMNLLMEIPPAQGRVVIIEANGTTDPTTLIEHLLVNEELRRRFSPLIQVALVDLQRWQKRHWHNELERLQVETASHILFTREQSTSSLRFEEIRRDIHSFNAKAQQIEVQTFAAEIEQLLQKSTSRNESGKDGTSGCGGSSHDHTPDHQHHHDHDQPDGQHQLSHAFIGLEIALPEPMSTTHLQRWLNALPKEVLRVKGVVRVTEEPDRWFQFQCVGEYRNEATLHTLPLKPLVPPCAVLIGVRLNEESIRSFLAATVRESTDQSEPARLG
tara:strand:+ start:1676 stop:2716 length:1041 start_codon:yes stop_codon:yes gene_type:complete